MNIWDIIDLTRSEVLDDTLDPYKWSNKFLLVWLNRAYEELCRESWCLIDSTTASVCSINLLANQGQHTLPTKIVRVLNMWRNSDGVPIVPKTEGYMEFIAANWRTVTGKPIFRVMDTGNRIFTVYPKYDTTGYIAGSSDIDFVVAAGPVYTIERPGATFTSHFSTGDSLVVTGTTSNNGTFTLSNVTDTILTVSSAVVADPNTSAILQLVREVAKLRVARLPLTMWTLAQLEGSSPPSPEIDETYHTMLTDGIAKWAFKKQDVETYDPNMAKFHEDQFEISKSQIRWDMATLMEGDTIMSPHYGSL